MRLPSSRIAGRFKRVLLFPILAKTEICHLHGRPQIADHSAQLAAAEARHSGARKASWICSGLAPSARAADRVSGAAAEPIAADASWRVASLPANHQRSGRAGRFPITAKAPP